MIQKRIWAVVAAICIIFLLLAGCTPVVPTSASTQTPGVSAQASLAVTAAPVTPTTSPSLTPQASPTVSASASASTSPSATQSATYKVAVSYDLDELKNSQKSVDEGHSPWKLDPAFVAQVFVSLQISPGGIVGDYPIPYDDFKVTQKSDSDAIVEVNNDKSPTAKVYLKRLVKQTEDGIWTVVGYDPK